MLKHLLNCVISTDNSNDENNRLILSESGEDYEQYFYDNAGNLTKKATQYTTEYYSYDGYNRLNAYYNGQTNAEYSYNVAGLRKSKTVNGNTTRFVYDGADVVGELTNDNYYVYYRATELIGYKAYTGESYYFRRNAHGDVTAILDVFGNEVENYSYDAFGEKKAFVTPPAGENTILYQWKAETEKIHNPFGYCGEYTDTETGLVYLRNRMYSPSIGRFITEDPIKDGLNWYAYCENDPINFCDVSGYAKSRKWGDTGQELLNYIKNSKTSITTYIYGQGNTSVASLKLGSAKVKDVGCETIAIHNALVATYDPHEYSNVLYECETIKMMNGMLGCDPRRIGEVLNAYDHLYAETKDVDQIDSLLNTGRVFIMSFWNDDKWKERLNPIGDSPGLHTIAFRKNDDGSYTAWNVYSNQTSARIYETFDGLKKETYKDDDNFIILYKLIEE